MFKDSLDINTSATDSFETFEFMDVRLRSLQSVRILIVYRPPNNMSYSLFFDEFSRLLEHVLSEPSASLMIAGDLNFHMENSHNAHTKQFFEILETFELKQHVCSATHASGHTLDLLITRLNEQTVRNIKIHDPMISDHLAVLCNLSLKKPPFRKKVISSRKLCTLDIDSFCEDVRNSSIVQEQPMDLDSAVHQYDNVLRSLLDQHAPLRKRLVTIRPAAPWYSPNVAAEKRIKRRLERKWRKSRLQSDREAYQYQCCVVNNLISSLKSTYYTSLINDHSSDQGMLFRTVNKLMQKSHETRYPPSRSNALLADSFADFFTAKVERIHTALETRNRNLLLADDDISPTVAVELNNFHEVSQEDVKEFAYKPLSKSCCLDPLPASIIKSCFPILLPAITRIVNSSLATGMMPDALKIASLSPTLKKPTADFKQLANFRPISNLKFISKLVEKCAAVQLTKHVMTNHLDETFQSAYKEFHSTETALLRVQNDILCALDQNKSVILLLLDLSAAFDTVDHAILVSRLSNRFGVKGTVLAWFKSYLTSRKQFVKVEEGLSSSRPLLRGVPQGSVLGPLLYLIYTAPIADIIKQHKLLYHLYADDTQLYISFKTDCCIDLEEAKFRVERCVDEIDRWMCNNLLKLNQDKTELVVISSKFRHYPDLEHIRVGDEYIAPKSSARNLGVIIDNCLCMEQHVKKICSEANYHLRNISKIRKYLTQDSAEILVHAFIGSKLDYCNSILYGIPKKLICKLQRIQNTAARIVTLTRKYDSITPIMFKLHWLPVQFRIIFKLLLIVYKALNDKTPSYVSSLLSFRKFSRSLRISDQELLTEPMAKLRTYGDRAFSTAAPRLWNKLPLSIRKSASEDIFKKNLKTYLYKEAYDI